MAILSLGPVDLRFFSGDNWSHAELAWVSNRNGGMARRETAVKGSFKSDHITDMIGKDLPSDTFECPETGTLYFGRIVQAPGGVHVISAKQIYTKAIYQKAVKQGLSKATSATAALEPTPAA